MKLDRNINVGGGGKYALLKLRRMRADMSPQIQAAVEVLEDAGILDWGDMPETEFFVMRLKDKYAGSALEVYAIQAAADDQEYGREVMDLSKRAGSNSPFCKMPD